jgi:hypothetical protein
MLIAGGTLVALSMAACRSQSGKEMIWQRHSAKGPSHATEARAHCTVEVVRFGGRGK